MKNRQQISLKCKLSTLLILAAVLIFIIAVGFILDNLNTHYRYLDIEIGMKYGVIYNTLPREKVIQYTNTTIVYENELGDCIVAKYDAVTSKIVQLSLVPAYKISKDDSRFTKIKPGMTIYEVTSIVGKPDSLSPTCFFGTDYTSTEGNLYRIWWTNGKVDRVEKYGESFTS